MGGDDQRSSLESGHPHARGDGGKSHSATELTEHTEKNPREDEGRRAAVHTRRRASHARGTANIPSCHRAHRAHRENPRKSGWTADDAANVLPWRPDIPLPGRATRAHHPRGLFQKNKEDQFSFSLQFSVVSTFAVSFQPGAISQTLRAES